MPDIFNHYYRTCFVANAANKKALMAPWMSLPADRPCCSWSNSREFGFTFLSSFQLALLKTGFFEDLTSHHFLKSTDDTTLHDHSLWMLEAFITGTEIQAN